MAQEPFLTERLQTIASCWAQYSETETRALRSAVSTGRYAVSRGRAAAQSTSEQAATAQVAAVHQALAAAEMGRVQAARASAEFPEGLLLGATVIRTRSLVVALAWHIAFNVPFHAYIACGTG